jgi:hypothetical protein
MKRIIRWLVGLLAVVLPAWFGSAADNGLPAAAGKAREGGVATEGDSYTRIHRPDTNTVQLQVAARKFLPARGFLPVVWLVGASHIGERDYYNALQEHLESQKLVLYEGVKPPQGAVSVVAGKAAPATGSQASGSDEGGAQRGHGGLQSSLAGSLGLVFQLEAINYSRPNFKNSDLSIAQIQALLASGAGNGPAGGSDGASGGGEKGGAEFAQLLQIMSGGSLLGNILKAGVNLIGSNARLQAMTKLMMIETLGRMKGDISQSPSLTPGLRQMLQTLIAGRNQEVIRDLQRELTKSSPPASIAIFYGAAHLADFESRLTRDFGYRPGEMIWFPAFSVELSKSGLTEEDLGMVRSLVQFQMRMLQPPSRP